MESVEQLPHSRASGPLCSSLIVGVKWFKKAAEAISVPRGFKRCNLSDVEEILAEVFACWLYCLFVFSRIYFQNFINGILSIHFIQ